MKPFVAVLTLFAAASFPGCRARPSDPPPLRIGVDVDAETLDPRLMRDTTAYRTVNLIYDGLIQLDASLAVRPGLATSWEQKDPTTWVFRLREDALFQDGIPLTSKDVVFTFETLADPALGAPQRMLYAPIREIVAVDPYRVEIRLFVPFAPLLSYLDLGIVPRHYVEQGGDLSTRPLGSGPYQLAEWDRDSRLALERHPTFWGEAPTIERLELRVVKDNTARTRAFEAGDLDVIQSPLPPADIARLAEDPRFVAHQQPGIAVTYFNFNTRRPELADPKMRRALAMLVDQKTIIEQIYQDSDREATSVLLPSSWSYTDSVRQPPYDPGQARRLLSELGWEDRDGNGFLEKNGRTLSIELSTHSEDVNRIQIIELMQHVMTRNGIEARVTLSDWASFTARRDAGDYDIILLGWTQLVDPDRILFDQLHSTGGQNWGGYGNEHVDALLSRGRTLSSLEERQTAYREAATILARELPYYVLSYQGYQLFYHRRLEGLEPDPRGMLRGLLQARRVD